MDKKHEFQLLVRVANTDVDGNKMVWLALRKIKGVNFMISNMLCSVAGIPRTAKIGALSATQIGKINEVLKDPVKFNVPSWLFNRRNDRETGEDIHLVKSDLDFTKDNDLKLLKKMRCYRGFRHMAKLPSRGQRTKSNFRKNKGKTTLGVKRKKK